MFDPKNSAKLKDCGVYVLDAPEDVFAVALRYLGLGSRTAKNAADYQKAADCPA